MTTIIVSIAAERFGEEEKKSSGTSYSKIEEDPQHQEGDESTEVPAQGGRRRGTHWPGPVNVHPTEEDVKKFYAGQSGIGSSNARRHGNKQPLSPTPSSSLKTCWGRSAA